MMAKVELRGLQTPFGFVGKGEAGGRGGNLHGLTEPQRPL